MAAGETQTWIYGQLHRKLQGTDVKASAYSGFTAALSDCAPLTLGFLAESEACHCFCPCSQQMGPWSAEKLASSEAVLYEGVLKCQDQQFTPEGLEQHCRDVMSNSTDSESRFLHGMIHKYLKSLFGQGHAAFKGPASEHGDDQAVVEEAKEEIPTAASLPARGTIHNSAEMDRLKQVRPKQFVKSFACAGLFLICDKVQRGAT